MYSPSYSVNIVQNCQIGHQLVVFNNLVLLIANIFCNDAVIAKEQPLGEVVKFFTLICCGLYDFSKLNIVDVFQQKNGANYSAQLSKSKVESVLFTLCAQSS